MQLHTHLGALIALPAIVLFGYYMLTAWNLTTLPIMILRPKDVYTTTEWKMYAALRWPKFFGKLFTCPICQIPYVTVVLTTLVTLYWSFSLNEWLWLVGVVSGSLLWLYTTNNFQPNVEVTKEKPAEIIKSASVPPSTLIHEIAHRSRIAPVVIPTDPVEVLKLYTKTFNIATNQDGKVEGSVKSVSEDLRAILPFFSSNTACWFEGCEELRAKHTEELEKSKQDGVCTSCVEGDLIRKYALRVYNQLNYNNANIT